MSPVNRADNLIQLDFPAPLEAILVMGSSSRPPKERDMFGKRDTDLPISLMIIRRGVTGASSRLRAMGKFSR